MIPWAGEDVMRKLWIFAVLTGLALLSSPWFAAVALASEGAKGGP
jgi:hypothetical protein